MRIYGSTGGYVMASTDAYFPFEATREYTQIDTEDIRQITCEHCGVVNVADVYEKGTLRCGACGAALSVEEEEYEEHTSVVFTEYKKPWWQFWK